MSSAAPLGDGMPWRTQYVEDDAAQRHTADADRIVAQYADAELQGWISAVTMLEAEAEELSWTRVDPVELPGLRRAAALLRCHIAAAAERH